MLDIWEFTQQEDLLTLLLHGLIQLGYLFFEHFFKEIFI